MDNKCPQGGSSGDFDNGLETFPVKVESSALYLGMEVEPPREDTVTDVMA